jgi:tRNA pseudouridine38-40 synthase
MAPNMSKRFKLTIAYDGSAYSGWQIQANAPSVQQVIETTLKKIIGHPVTVHGSGRTDQGVHARGQVAHVDIDTPMKPESLCRVLNGRLPLDIRILKASIAKPDFHARISAKGKEYRYTVWNDPICLPDRRLYTTYIYRPLNLVAMQEGARQFVGRHDFASFTANPHRAIETTVRSVYSFTVSKRGKEILFRVSGEGFLYKQVRSMVGFLIRIGEGAEKPTAVAELLTSCAPRKARVPSAPPNGLSLWRVWYK